MPEQQATAGAHSRIIQVFGDGNVIGSQPYLSLRVPSLKPSCAVPGVHGGEASLLGPGAGATAFVGREEICASFVGWANSHDSARPVSVRVVHGGAGVGKTRFAMELCRELGPEWQAGFVDGIEARRFFRQTNLADWGWQKPVLVVFDYALTLLDVLPDWMRELCAIQESPHPLRIVLLERQAGEGQGGWLERAFPGGFGILPTCPRDLLDGEPRLLPGMADFAMQRGIMQDMLERLGSVIVLPTDDAAFRDRLTRTDWAGAPLYLMMAAMVMHRQGGMGDVLHLGRADLAHAVADHELERLRQACQGADAGRAALELFLPHMAAVSSLCGGLPEEIVSDCVRREKTALGCESVDTAVALQRLRDLLPDEGRAGIAPIRPDIVGEAFVLARLGNGQANDGKDAVLRAFADCPSEVAAVLVRCVQDFAPRGADAASAREDQDQERALAWLRAMGDAPNLPLPSLLIVVDALPHQTLALRSLAVEWERRAVAFLREQAAANPDLCATLARNLNNFANRLSNAGQRQEALTIAAEVATRYRELAVANPDAFRPLLAMSLNNLANSLSEAGQNEKALTIAGEAVAIRRELAAANPDAFRPDLAMSLNNLAVMCSDAGLREKALTIAGEAVELFRELAAANPDAFRPVLAGSLNTLANRLSGAGQRQEALTIARESATIYWTLFQNWPEYFRSNLMIAMTTWLSLRHSVSREEALAMFQQDPEPHIRALFKDADDATDTSANEGA